MSFVIQKLQEAGMLNEEKRQGLMEAKEMKTLGNEYFGQRNYKDAIRTYHQALMKIRAVNPPFSDKSMEEARANSMPQETAEFFKETKQLEVLCHLNLAACLIAQTDRKPDDYTRAAQYCDKVLDGEPNNLKALYRKGIALYMANNYHSALSILKNVDIRLHGRDEKIREYLSCCEKKVKENENQLKERMSKAFGDNPSASANSSMTDTPTSSSAASPVTVIERNRND